MSLTIQDFEKVTKRRFVMWKELRKKEKKMRSLTEMHTKIAPVPRSTVFNSNHPERLDADRTPTNVDRGSSRVGIEIIG